VLAYETQLENLCDQVMRETDQEKLTKLMDQILQLLAENQEVLEKSPVRILVAPIYEEYLSNKHFCPGLAPMPCKSCGSLNQNKFTAEMGIHFRGLKNIDKPVVWIFPELIVCLNCGTTEFVVPEPALRQLAEKEGAAAAG